MQISFLQAGNGDCILLRGGGKNVLIDSGEDCAELRNVVIDIRNAQEAIDLLVITHYDSDHIKTIVSILKELCPNDRKSLLKEVWFNATKVGFRDNVKELSANDAVELGRLLLEADIPWISELNRGKVKEISSECSLEVIDGGSIFKNDTHDGLLSNIKSDWSSTFKELEQYVDDDAQDCSSTNAQSSIIVAHINGRNILLPGDAIPRKLSEALDYYRKGQIVSFDLVKLPHHGSYKNITHDILKKFECTDYVVSTDGSKFFHPNKKMMMKIIKWGQKKDTVNLKFHLNYYDDLIKKMNISESNCKSYNFECDGKRTFEF